MKKWVIDTNVLIVANGRWNLGDDKQPSTQCRLKTISFLKEVLRSGRILLDRGGAIQEEYRRHLNPSGQPGVGDRFYQEVLNSAPRRIMRVELPKLNNEEYSDLPSKLVQNGFDPGDRKFAALAKKMNATVANATDSDWLNFHALLKTEDIKLYFVCGCDRTTWFSKK